MSEKSVAEQLAALGINAEVREDPSLPPGVVLVGAQGTLLGAPPPIPPNAARPNHRWEPYRYPPTACRHCGRTIGMFIYAFPETDVRVALYWTHIGPDWPEVVECPGRADAVAEPLEEDPP